MARSTNNSLFGVGIYSVPDASRLSGVSAPRIRRWLAGYTYEYRGSERRSPSVWPRQIPEMAGKPALGFLDLLEVRFINELRRLGVSWKTIRRASECARDWFGTDHPFSTQKLKTDGRNLFATVRDETGEESLYDLVRSQYAFSRVLAPYLKNLEFGENDQAVRWWPLGLRRRVVIDPFRSFGQPIVSKEGIPTAILASAAAAEDSMERVAAWYGVATQSVRNAVDFEAKLAA